MRVACSGPLHLTAESLGSLPTATLRVLPPLLPAFLQRPSAQLPGKPPFRPLPPRDSQEEKLENDFWAFPKVTASVGGEDPAPPSWGAFSLSALPSLPSLQEGSQWTLSGLSVFFLSWKISGPSRACGLARPGLWSSDTAALYSLSFCSGAGIAVFLDPPDIAKTSSTWRCRTGLLACVAEASCLKLRRHMLGALVCCRGWWRGWCVLFWLHLDRFTALRAVCAWGCVGIQD